MATKIISTIPLADRKKLDIRSGDQVRVWQKIEEDTAKGLGKFRLQAFEGLVLARKHGSEAGATFTVRKVVDGVGVERIFPLFSPMIDEIELVRRSKVRHAKLYFIREKATKEIRKQMRRILSVRDPGQNTDTKHGIAAEVAVTSATLAVENKEEAVK
ncbi:MAG: 50S ribosomal protein L19 [Candidatus Taylorbacteria bacterium RIFCSPHIGHO2_01_FULL_44_110]|uniref:50S ribosomal protein L19 n=1 Tax=Candidatus Taylorbacteria bacterium RIFCSPHIGHO2_12_FULL_45_16 TaxID=1802315 RepID=A0A1G2MYI6_9BACT|nr:MAG: 50S ribosomal protein L19 [Candidatus Taylorbacteria bacterium RIFCSPHIGHO2_01_FULL_44_110]OHA28843.1 MAG: 50S ribosomal protein L19 [Candidatus Taylorbacteria bacterium RIFCSPHIGHO2_12_FULL_45_16]OHA32901.1 MAG: 50S ribosomal protein L19 [Candidatus Taylorbacteria bacterium RIFCSPLOWO2_01_FULL_45_59]OHA39779.1 MAG: 50S ribosomal protein L19 [Candidatus Taylorbacteria bacterium RIFCSPLOWO2_02_FULL_45_10b]